MSSVHNQATDTSMAQSYIEVSHVLGASPSHALSRDNQVANTSMAQSFIFSSGTSAQCIAPVLKKFFFLFILRHFCTTCNSSLKEVPFSPNPQALLHNVFLWSKRSSSFSPSSGTSAQCVTPVWKKTVLITIPLSLNPQALPHFGQQFLFQALLHNALLRS